MGIAAALPRSLETLLGLGLGSGLGEIGLESGHGLLGAEVVRWFALGLGLELWLWLWPLSI